MIRTRIYPNELFDREALCTAFKCNTPAIGREIRLGRLKVYGRLNRQWFLGADVLEWIKGGALERMKKESAELKVAETT